MDLQAFVEASMVGQDRGSFGLRRMRCQYKLDLHLWQLFGDLLRCPSLVFQLPQGGPPEGRQGIHSGLHFDGLAELIGRVLLGHPQELKGDRIGLG